MDNNFLKGFKLIEFLIVYLLPKGVKMSTLSHKSCLISMKMVFDAISEVQIVLETTLDRL